MPHQDAYRSHRRHGLVQRLFAWMLARSEGVTNRLLETRKRALFSGLRGTVVELGPGTGANLPYLPREVRWIGVEPNPYMHRYLREKAARLGREISLLCGMAEQLPLAGESADAVITTLVLCSVDNVPQVLGEVRRVLRPGGRFIFIEHVAAPRGTLLRRIQEAVRPVWTVVADGCHPDRETWAALEAAGFSDLRYERFELPVPLKIIAPCIAGSAVKEAVT
jgi:ubiquinone/menaquinone biosynthesis C-methylase UbiE